MKKKREDDRELKIFSHWRHWAHMEVNEGVPSEVTCENDAEKYRES